jgi:adiponectin receptor
MRRASTCYRPAGVGSSGGFGGWQVWATAADGRRRCEFISYDKLPEFLKHKEFIVDYYHSEWPVKEALLSAFSIVHPQ